MSGQRLEARSPDGDARQVLEERARRLAQPPSSEADLVPSLELLVFSLSGERYGVDASRVVEVLRTTPPTPLPGVRPFLAGVVNHRGQILAVLDLGGLLGLKAAAERPGKHIVVVEAQGMTFGLRADEVAGIERVSAGEAAPAAGPRTGLPAWVRGTTGGMVSVLDLDALAGDPRIMVDEAE